MPALRRGRDGGDGGAVAEESAERAHGHASADGATGGEISLQSGRIAPLKCVKNMKNMKIW